MNIFVERTGKQHVLEFAGTVSELLEQLQVNPETVLVSRDGQLLVVSDEVSPRDTIQILSVISGG